MLFRPMFVMDSRQWERPPMRVFTLTLSGLVAALSLTACTPPLSGDEQAILKPGSVAAATCSPADANCQKGEAILKESCARCHSIERHGVSPYPGAQPFRSLKQRWSQPALREALKAGITAEHDQSGIKLPIMKLGDQEIDAVFAYLDALNRASAPGGPGR